MAGFFTAWEDYAQQLELQAMALDAEGFGSNLALGDIEDMSPEQHEQLVKLSQAAREAAAGRA